MPQNSVIIFVCEHGAAKSILAATYFNHLAGERDVATHAIARGTNPDVELSPNTIQGLQSDGLVPTESWPQRLTLEEVESAEQIISFCELPKEFQNRIPIERWNNVPPVGEDYEKARDTIVRYINQLFNTE